MLGALERDNFTYPAFRAHHGGYRGHNHIAFDRCHNARVSI